MIEAYEDYINSLIYYACDGRPGDIRAIEQGSYIDMLVVLINYLDKVERHNEHIEKLQLKTKAKNGRIS